ncbi:MAG: DUF885 domain-containing protein, partial [Sphingomonadales bacterium]|nr:DUF885 domain-containing protein [Sphingomonadales bacterium]
MDRRHFLTCSSLAVGGLSLTTASGAVAAPTGDAGAGDAKLNALFDAVFKERVARSPQLASSLGLDKGANASLKSTLDLRPDAVARAED